MRDDKISRTQLMALLWAGVMAPAAELLRPLVDEVHTTRLGSVVGARRCGRENAPRLLLDAHLDEIGLIVTGHEEGFLRFAPLGGVDPRMLPDREVVLLTDPPIPGVVACLPPHVQTAEDMDKSLPIKDLYIDVGAGSRAQAEAVSGRRGVTNWADRRLVLNL